MLPPPARDWTNAMAEILPGGCPIRYHAESRLPDRVTGRKVILRAGVNRTEPVCWRKRAPGAARPAGGASPSPTTMGAAIPRRGRRPRRPVRWERFSLRLGHLAALTAHRAVIHYRSAASLRCATPALRWCVRPFLVGTGVPDCPHRSLSFCHPEPSAKDPFADRRNRE